MEEDWLARPKYVEPSLAENQMPLFEVESMLDHKIIEVLRSCGIESLFPVQKAVLEELAQRERENPFCRSQDLLVSASTGSGKTLSYLLPVLNSLSGRLVCRLRALIVVPGRELAHQVAAVLEPFTAALGLTMAVVVGQTSMVAEQKKVVAALLHPEPMALDGCKGGSSRADILIATPGRLVDHLRCTPGFTLQHLQWLIIDEADRLLDQSFQDWLPLVLESAKGCSPEALPVTLAPCHDGIALRENVLPPILLAGLNIWATPFRKLLFSATLTRNPAKLAQLHLNNPVYLAVTSDSQKYSVPPELEESMVVTEEGSKVAVLLYLMQASQLSRSLCFTKSVQSTEKYSLRMSDWESEGVNGFVCVIEAFSGNLIAGRRAEILAQFDAGQLDMLICSDGAARGLDLQQVASVINYDVPVHAKTYIHRVGRTARAGQAGRAYSILEEKEARHFKQMLAEGRAGNPVKKIRLRPEDLEPWKAAVETALAGMQQDGQDRADQISLLIMQQFRQPK